MTVHKINGSRPTLADEPAAQIGAAADNGTLGCSGDAIIAVDPGKDKCGMAVLGADGVVGWQGIIPTAELTAKATALSVEYGVKVIVMGNGTTSKRACAEITAALPDIAVDFVDEFKTTELARRDYFAAHPPKGWRRLLPRGLQVPPVPVDDYAAVRLGRKYLAKEIQR